jgi:hypothetical protein
MLKSIVQLGVGAVSFLGLIFVWLAERHTMVKAAILHGDQVTVVAKALLICYWYPVAYAGPFIIYHIIRQISRTILRVIE